MCMSNVPGNRNKAFWLWFLCEKQRYLLRSCRRASLFLEPDFTMLPYNNTNIAFGFLHVEIFRDEQRKHNTTSYIKPVPFLINFISCRKKKSDGHAQKCLGMQARNSFANVLTLVVFVFFFPPFLLVIVAYSYGQQWLWAKHAAAGTHELGARRYNYITSWRHSTKLGSSSTVGQHSTKLGSW